jgi:hypothetical protein
MRLELTHKKQTKTNYESQFSINNIEGWNEKQKLKKEEKKTPVHQINPLNV